MSRLLAQLLMLARADANKIQFEIEKFDFSEMAEIVIEETQQIAGAKEITVNAAIEPEVCVEGDQTLLMRLLLNLLDNAVKYTETAVKLLLPCIKKKAALSAPLKIPAAALRRRNCLKYGAVSIRLKAATATAAAQGWVFPWYSGLQTCTEAL